MLAFERLDGFESSIIYLSNADGTEERPLTKPRLCVLSPVWSPNGDRIAFNLLDMSTTTTNPYVVNMDGTGMRRLSDEPFAVSERGRPDGRAILLGKLAAHHSVHTLDLHRGELTHSYTAPRSQTKGVNIHDTTWSSTPS